ncbi:hypothetical protein [Streptomyces virginiae]|uniref:hypothetical protein n=1 Tax=Streptomyces virginiae TaxID=1961 RepID=UPI00365C4EEA
MNQSLGDEELRRAPARKPAPPLPPSPYRRAPIAPATPMRRGPVEEPPKITPAGVLNLPPGYRAQVEKEPASTGFLGKAFAMDSLDFLCWAAEYFHDDLLTLRVLILMMGSQQPGGEIQATQKQIGARLRAHRVHVNRSVGILYRLGVVHMVTRGVYQLNPAASMRGGVVEVRESGEQAFSTGDPVFRRIDQLTLLKSLRDDPKVSETFKQLELPTPLPKARKPRENRRKATAEASEE